MTTTIELIERLVVGHEQPNTPLPHFLSLEKGNSANEMRNWSSRKELEAKKANPHLKVGVSNVFGFVGSVFRRMCFFR